MRAPIAVAAAMVVLLGAASAQEYPDLRGTWVGNAEAIFVNTAQYYEEGKDAVVFGMTPVVVVIDEQQGHRFSGTVK